MSTNTLVISTTEGVKAIKTIFHWVSTQGKESHCLLRIYVDKLLHGRAAVIASELNSNRHNTDIGHDFEGLAKAVVRDFSSELSIDLPQIIWIEHFGRFSQPLSYENIAMRDDFAKIDLPWNGEQLQGKRKWTYLKVAEVNELIGWTNLEPVAEVLDSLNK